MKNKILTNYLHRFIRTNNTIHKKIALLSFYLFLINSLVFAEGSKEIYIGGYSTHFYLCNDSINHCNSGGGDRSLFATYGCDSLDRLNFFVNSTNEVVYLGFNASGSGGSAHVVYRIKDINGNTVKTEEAVPVSGVGYISSINEAREGPVQLVGAAGYDAIVFYPPSIGYYYIEFNRVLNSSPTTTSFGSFELDLLDITVANSITNTAIPGRLYSHSWQLYEQSNCSATFFIYSTDSIITSLSLNDMSGGIWTMYSNQSGCSNTGNFYYDRKSIPYEATPNPQYRIFLNEPDNNIFPPATILGSITSPITSQTYCEDGTVDFNVEVNKAGNVEIILLFDPPYETRSIMSVVESGTNIITWDGYDGASSDSLPVPNNINITYTVSYVSGLTNFPMYDVEVNSNGLVVELVSPPGSTPLLYWDDSNIGGGTNFAGCASTLSPWSGCHSFAGNLETVNSWTYTTSTTAGPYAFVNERNPDSLIFVQQPPQYYSPGNSNISFSVVADPNSDNYLWNYTGNDVTINHINPSDNFITIDFGSSATSGDLQVYGTNSNCPNPGVTSILVITIGPPPLVDAEFSGTPVNGDAPLLVSFTDLSTGSVDSWSWGFGDGNSSTDQNPSHTYSSIGTFTVSLTVTDLNGSDTETKTDYISVAAPIITADFEGDLTSGDAPLNVTFSDLSTGNITSWLWDFGDGNTATDQNPSHTYSNPGTYTVSLTISDLYSSTSETKPDYISAATPIIMAEFDGTPTTGEIPLDVSFTDLSTGNIVSWLWEFGDGNTSTDQNPVHTYNGVGTFTISLTVTDQFNSDIETKTDYITASPPLLIAEFVGNPVSGDYPLEVTFTDISVGNADSWLWDFGDGNTSTIQNPVNTYLDEGEYTVSLMITDQYGSDTEIKTDYITVAAIVANFDAYPLEGNTPLYVTFSDLSTGEIDSWQWDFGDGNTSSFQLPVHTYTETGTFTITLIITGVAGSDTIVKTDYINVYPPAPVADFSASPTYGEAPLLVNFSDLSSGEIDTWNWDFGDGASSSTQHTMHEYLSPGNYTVSLSVEGIGGDDTMIKEDYILIPVGTVENPSETIIVYPNPVSDKLHIVFTNNKSRKLLLKNMEGRNILTTKTAEKEVVLDIQSIPTGLYSLIIECLGTSPVTVKVVKK